MSLKTRCPACDTVFKIVPDQLKVSKGWVRCGRCAEVFDAAAHVTAADEAAHKLQTNQTQPVTNSTPPSKDANTSSTATTPVAKKNTAKTVTVSPKNIASKATNTLAVATLKKMEGEPQSNLSFVKVAKSKAFWLQRNVIIGLRTACVGLVGLLFFQVVFSQRSHLVASNPELKPSFESLCQTIGCTIEPFKNIDAFKIDSSSFQKAPVNTASSTEAGAAAQAEFFALKINVKNNASITLAMPSVELTLTDAGDKPVLRRVLSTHDFGYTSATLAPKGDWTGEVTIALTANRGMPPISGYRVFLFYP